MASYRFCRTDDVALLVQAHNVCYRPHFPDVPPLTVDGFRRAAKEIDLWASSCMVATSGDEPIGVLLACKREEATLIWRVGIHPQHLRQGHGRHLMTSLSAKLAILGPAGMLAEVPAEWEVSRAFFEACRWREETRYTDFVLETPPSRSEPSELLIPISVDELIANDVLDTRTARCWSRAPKSLINRKDSLQGLAVAPTDRIEAYLLHDGSEIMTLGFPGSEFSLTPGSPSEAWAKLLFRHHAGLSDQPVQFKRTHPDEVDSDLLRGCAFESTEITIGYVARPQAG